MKAISPAPYRVRYLYEHFRKFDRLVAQRIPESPSAVVIGYENSCEETFRAARKSGKLCVLDAASVHFDTQRKAWPEFPAGAFWDDVNARKAREIGLADHILTLSSFARESYVSAGIPANKVSVVGLGFDPDAFRFIRRDVRNVPFRFLFVGSLSPAKGVGDLIRAFQGLELPDAELVLVGGGGEVPSGFGRIEKNVRFTGYLGRDRLIEEYAAAHVLVFPSRFDGFGQVVVEAMSTGLPVIVSNHVGAGDLVRHGENGWIVRSGDVEDLQARMHVAWRDRLNLAHVGEQASRDVSGYTWAAYRRRVFYCLQALVA
jgi:glycosyltransferase involved in cell wall biosynthesis